MRERQLGEYIAQKRRELGITQEALGRALGFSGKAVSKWERGLGFPDVDTIHALAGILHCKAEALLHGRDELAVSSDRSSRTVMRDWPLSSAQTENVTVSPLLFGGNLEHSRSAVSGGLSAQMLRNRKFVGMPTADGNPLAWFHFGEKCYSMIGSAKGERPADHTEPHVGSYTRHADRGYRMPRRYECNSWQLQNFGETVGFGQGGLYVEAEREYEFAIVLHTDAPVSLTVTLTSHKGRITYATAAIAADGADWQRYTVSLAPCETDDDAELRVSFSEPTRLVIGALSLMPCDHFHGMRRDVIDRLREMRLSFLRWPGGNFAGEYNWFDGLLDVDMRAPSESHIPFLTQPHTFGYDFGELNTDDFITLCREIGAEPSITLNLTWNTPEENAAWVEYCNGDETTEMGRVRMSRGFREPFNVKYWSLGNEAGYGHMEGDNTPEGYYRIAARNAEALLAVDPSLILSSSGFHPDEHWVREANAKLGEAAPWVALHNYTAFPDYRVAEERKDEYRRALFGVEENRHKIRQLHALLGDGLSVAFDEWNCWYSWYRPCDVFSGIFAAKMFAMLIHEQAPSRLSAAAVFQPIGEGCIEITPTEAKLTPMGQAFRLLAHHVGGKLLWSDTDITITQHGERVILTAVNDALDATKEVSLAPLSLQSGTLLVGEGIGPFTNFHEQPLCVCDGTLTLPPLSIAMVTATHTNEG